MTGTDKQIEWATKIRAAKLAQVETFVAEGVAKLGASALPDKAGRIARIEAAGRYIAGRASAAWWIDRRDQDAKWMILDLCPRPGQPASTFPDPDRAAFLVEQAACI